MKQVILICLLALFVSAFARMTPYQQMTASLHEKLDSAGVEGVRGDLSPQWYTQTLDHFDGTPGTFQQLYYVNDEYWVPGGPIFLLVQGEGPLDPVWGTHSSAVEYAQTHNAVLLLPEHRFYGQTQPMPDWSEESLAFLTSRQSLADNIEIAQWWQQQNNATDSKIIAQGGSYSGALSAWIREVYPDVIHGAIATSAPVEALLDFYQYVEVDYHSLGGECADRIRAANAKILTMTNEELDAAFPMCYPASSMNSDDLLDFYQNIAGGPIGTVQYNNWANKDMNIVKLCDVMVNGHIDPVEAYSELVAMYNEMSGVECNMNNYTADELDVQQTVVSFDDAMRQWSYQTCMEFGYYQSSHEDDESQSYYGMFPLDFQLKQSCDDAFPALNNPRPDIDGTNKFYNGKDVSTSRIMFVNGDIDPWHYLSVLEARTGQPNVYIPGGSHCEDMHATVSTDTNAMVEARTYINKVIGQFLAED